MNMFKLDSFFSSEVGFLSAMPNLFCPVGLQCSRSLHLVIYYGRSLYFVI